MKSSHHATGATASMVLDARAAAQIMHILNYALMNALNKSLIIQIRMTLTMMALEMHAMSVQMII